MAKQFPLGLGEQPSRAELEFIDYFNRIDPRSLAPVEKLFQKLGPRGYGTSLFLARMVKVKEGITSDRELCQKLERLGLYRFVCNLRQDKIPAASTFSGFRKRLGPAGYRAIHNRFVDHAHRLGLLDQALPGLPKNLRPGIILLGDSTFLLTTGSTQGEKQPDGTWLFTDRTARFGRRHPHHRYAVGHRVHSLTTVTGIPLVSRVVGANEADVTQLIPMLEELLDRYPRYQFAYVVLDAGYDSEEAYRRTFEELGIVPVIIQEKDSAKRDGFTRDWRPLCPFKYPLRRDVVDYRRRRTKWACYKVCRLPKPGQQLLLLNCESLSTDSPRGFVRYTYFRDSYRHLGPAAPNTQAYEFLKPLRTGIERTYGLAKSNRYRMEVNNTYVGADNVLMHVIEHDIVLTQDIINDYLVDGKLSPVVNANRARGRNKTKPWDPAKKRKKNSAKKKKEKRQAPVSEDSRTRSRSEAMTESPQASLFRDRHNKTGDDR